MNKIDTPSQPKSERRKCRRLFRDSIGLLVKITIEVKKIESVFIDSVCEKFYSFEEFLNINNELDQLYKIFNDNFSENIIAKKFKSDQYVITLLSL